MSLDLQSYRQRIAQLAAQSIFIGTSSWKYPGWCGQVYDEQRYLTRNKFSESKFIIGADVISESRRLNLYVENTAGYSNLCRLLSAPCVTPALLASHREGLITVNLDEDQIALPEIRYRKPRGSPEDRHHPKFDGLHRRYGAQAHLHEAQLREELGIIAEVGYEEYFLTTWDILQECSRRGIAWITRGSAADSLVCYRLEISGAVPFALSCISDASSTVNGWL